MEQINKIVHSQLQKDFIMLTFANFLSLNSVQFSRSVVSESLQPHEPQHTRPPCPSPSPALAGGFFITDTTWEALSPMAYFNILINRTLALPTQITLQHATHRMTIPLRNPYNSSTECTQVLHILLNLKLET